MIIHSERGVSWVLESHREDCDSASFRKLISKLSKEFYVYGQAFMYGSVIQVVASTEHKSNSCFDFASELASFPEYKKKPRILYVERILNSGAFAFFVELSKGVPARSFIAFSEEEALEELSLYLNCDEPVEVHAFGLDDVVEQHGLVIDTLPAPLSELLEPSAGKSFKQLKDLQLRKKNKPVKTFLLAGLAISAIGLFIANQVMHPDEAPSIQPQRVVHESPWLAYEKALTEDAIYAYERILQDFAFHELFRNGPGANGWVIDGVSVSTNGQIYTLSRSGQASDRDLERFAQNEQLLAVVGEPVLSVSEREVSLQIRGRNRPLPFANLNLIFDVRELQDLLSQAVAAYVPGAELRFIRDHNSGNFVKRQLELRFRGVYWDDLIGFGAMTRDYPVTMSRGSGESVLGGYAVSPSDERLTGSLFITLVGE